MELVPSGALPSRDLGAAVSAQAYGRQSPSGSSSRMARPVRAATATCRRLGTASWAGRQRTEPFGGMSSHLDRRPWDWSRGDREKGGSGELLGQPGAAAIMARSAVRWSSEKSEEGMLLLPHFLLEMTQVTFPGRLFCPTDIYPNYCKCSELATAASNSKQLGSKCLWKCCTSV